MVKSAWIWIVGESKIFKLMKVEEIKSLCKSRDLVICKNSVMFEADDLAILPETEYIRKYGFVVGEYDYPPHIDLVPRGTTVEFGMYVFPKEQKL